MKIRFTAILIFLALLVTSASWAVGTFPDVGEYEVLRGDFHMHTVSSDGKLTARQRIDGQKKRGIDALAITDHGNTRVVRFEMQYAPALGMVPVRGVETGLAWNMKYHLVALGFDPLYQPKDPHNWSLTPNARSAYYRDEMNKLKNAGGLLIMAHPKEDSLGEAYLWGIEQGIIQGIEVHNGKKFNPISFEWALKYNLAIFANSDAHGAPAPDYTLVLVKERSEKGIMNAIRARRTIALYEGVFWGREDMLSMLVKSMIKVRTEEENGNRYIVLENTGPIKMNGIITGTPEQSIEIVENSKTRIPWTGSKTISIRWENVNINLTDKLVTKFDAK